MSRSQRQRRQKQARRTRERAAVELDTAPAPASPPGQTKPVREGADLEPWSVRGYAAIVGIVVVLQILAGIAYYYGSNRRGTYPEHVLGFPFAPLPIPFFLCFLIAMPPAQRLTRQPRNLRFVETLSLAAVALILVFAVGALSINATLHADYRVQLGSLTVAEAVAYAATCLLYPPMYRRFWTQRRFSRR